MVLHSPLARRTYCTWANSASKELGSFHIIFALTLTAHNICLTHIKPSILISANALGYNNPLKLNLLWKHDVNLFILLCIERGSIKYNFQKIEKDQKNLLIFNVKSCESANI